MFGRVCGKIHKNNPKSITSTHISTITHPSTPQVKVQVTQTMENPPTRMELIVASRYAPLVLP